MCVCCGGCALNTLDSGFAWTAIVKNSPEHEVLQMVYVLNRDSAANLTISSPLEAHKSHTITFAICGMDQGFDNPMFAAIELDYADADQALFEASSLSSAHARCPLPCLCSICSSAQACIVMHSS